MPVDGSPTSKEVELFHRHADTDGSAKAIHHTLGNGKDQASPGNHSHDGGTSPRIDPKDILADTVTITGNKTTGDATWRNSITAALVALGAKDATT